MAQESGKLSKRECTIAERYAAGDTHKDIAAALHIAPVTVRNHVAAIYRKLGVQNKPQLIGALSAHGLLPADLSGLSAPLLRMLDADLLPATAQVSVAVMPFEHIGAADQDYLSHGIAADVHHDLTRFRDLFVSGRTSCLAAGARTDDVTEAARRLGVRFVVKGASQIHEQRARVTAELVEGSTGEVLWSERYDRELHDLFELQTEVARAIAANLSVQIEDAQYARRRTVSEEQLSAYDWQLRGARHLELGGVENLNEARHCFTRALEIAPESAPAHTGLSLSYGYECDQLLATDYACSSERHLEFAEKAVALDELDSRAHYAMCCALTLTGQLERADAHAARAVELNPSEYHNLCSRGYTLMSLNRMPESIACFGESLRRNPLAPNSCLMALGLIEYLESNYGQCAHATTRLSPSYVQRFSSLAAAYGQLGLDGEARLSASQLRAFVETLPTHPAGPGNSDWRDFWRLAYPYVNPAGFDHLLEGLAKSGLPA